MKYKINHDTGEKAYMQLYEQLKRDITSGIYGFGERMPSKRMLSDETGVSVITVEHAYSLLCDEGFAEAHERSGYFVIYKTDEFISLGDVPLSKPHVNVHPHVPKSSIPFSVMSKTMRRVIQEQGENILTKSPNQGCIELRMAIVSYLARTQGIYIEPEQVFIGSGAEYLYSLIAQLFQGHTFALESPSYDKIKKVYEACGVACDMLSLSGDGINSESLNLTQADILHITPFNSFPSGVTASASKRAEYIRWSENRRGYIIEDNYDSELTVSVKNDSTVFSLSESGRVIYVNTFTQTVAPSIRVGYMVLPKNLLSDFYEKLGFYSCTVPIFDQYVLAELITSGDFERHINRVRRARRKLL